MRPLDAEDGPKGSQPGLDAGGLQVEDEVGEVCRKSLLRTGAVGHPEGVVEACPKLAGVEGGEGAAGGEEGLEGGEGFGAEFAVYNMIERMLVWLCSEKKRERERERERDGPLEARFLIKGICCASCAETAAVAAMAGGEICMCVFCVYG